MYCHPVPAAAKFPRVALSPIEVIYADAAECAELLRVCSGCCAALLQSTPASREQQVKYNLMVVLALVYLC